MTTIFGGELCEYPKDAIRRWPSRTDEKRGIDIDLATWVGTAIGASHYRITVQEEVNGIWDEDENGWRVCWDENDHGSAFTAVLTDQKEVLNIVKRFVKWASHGEADRPITWSSSHLLCAAISKDKTGKSGELQTK